MEVGYTKFYDSTNSRSDGVDSESETLNGSSFRLAAVGSYPLSNSFDVFAKLGLARTTLDYTRDVTIGGVNSSVSASGTEINFMYGFGLQYNFFQHWGIRAQYESLGKTQVGSAGDAYNSNVGVKVYSLGGVYKF